MKKTMISMVYPMLISLFLFCFVSVSVVEGLEPLQLISAILTLIFGVLFIIGFILNIVSSIKKNNLSPVFCDCTIILSGVMFRTLYFIMALFLGSIADKIYMIIDEHNNNAIQN